jgi:hypothetical protein
MNTNFAFAFFAFAPFIGELHKGKHKETKETKETQ